MSDAFRLPSDPKTVLAKLPAEFVGSFPDPLVPLTPPLPEAVLLGRSNVGKSSLINALTGRRIAKTSGTPGKTQHLVAFRFPDFYLVDLPGYGYAKLGQTERRQLRALVEGVVGARRSVTAVVWLLDVRHAPSAEDYAIRELLAQAGRQTIVVLTKADKLSQAERAKAVRERARALEVDPEDVVVTSSTKLTGVAELAEMILDACAGG